MLNNDNCPERIWVESEDMTKVSLENLGLILKKKRGRRRIRELKDKVETQRRSLIKLLECREGKDSNDTQIERFYVGNKKNTKIIHFESTDVTSIWQQRLSCSVNSSRCRRLIESLTRRDDI